MHLVAMVHPPTSQYAENWQHPLVRTGWLDARFYADLARTHERGCFDMMFMPDALAVPEDHGGSYATTDTVATCTVLALPGKTSPHFGGATDDNLRAGFSEAAAEGSAIRRIAAPTKPEVAR